MKISDLFYVFMGSKLDFDKQTEDELGIIFVSRNSNNNGIVGRVSLETNMKTYEKGDITVSLGGSYLLSCFVQNKPFVTAQNVAVLRAKNENMTDLEKWFYCYALRANRFKFSAFGREVNKYLKNIEVPDTVPKWVYKASLDVFKTNNSNKLPNFNHELWENFYYTDIFIIRKGFYNKKPEHNTNGQIPFLGATEKNNGVTEYYSIEDIENASKTGDENNAPISEKIFPPNSVCVTNNGSVGFAYFQESEFTCSHDVNPLYIKNGEFNVYTGLFVATVIMRDRYRWDYGRKWRPTRMGKSVIKLPATKNDKGEIIPDWEYMEKYVKSLPYGDKV